ncbi:hypothetical protein B0T22DRAFT_537606 [Podospora appendiculata]|uniref:Uncharacterized protein n=1 Tax=Podospora appendiculata TaxID=314037 RepID=A0AAE0X521_9PEZI|nr:hypothetical protein B0T22DRAFT_537606 [Podospora appendiculata]
MADMAAPEEYILELAGASFDTAALWVVNKGSGIAEDGSIDIKDLRNRILCEMKERIQKDRLADIASLALASGAQSIQSDLPLSIPRHMVRVRSPTEDVSSRVSGSTGAQASATKAPEAPEVLVSERAVGLEENREPSDEEMEIESIPNNPREDVQMGNSEIGDAGQLEGTQAEEVQMEVDAQILNEVAQVPQEVPQPTAIKVEGSKRWKCLLWDIKDPSKPCDGKINRKSDIRAHNERDHHLFAPGSSREFTADKSWIEKLKSKTREVRLGVEKGMLRQLEARCRRARELLQSSNALESLDMPQEPEAVLLDGFMPAPASLSLLRVKLHQWRAVDEKYAEMLRDRGLDQVFAASEDALPHGNSEE